MINTRIYDRAPLKDVRVKEPQVGRVRTPQILMSRTNEGYQKGDILDANATAELTKSIHMPDIDKVNEKLEQTVNKDQIGKPNGVASLDSTGNVPIGQLSNIDTDLFVVVSELPTEDIKEGKIYCIKDTSSTAQDNGYIEYAYINNKWEKIGEFQATPDLSGYAKLSGAKFSGNVNLNGPFNSSNGFNIRYLNKSDVGYLKSGNAPTNLINEHTTYNTNGGLSDIGTSEDLVFTLEDGSTVTKSIRVISTTSQAGA